MSGPIIKIEALAKSFESKERKGVFSSKKKTVHALKGISLEIREGELFGLLGPNGAGKTTLIKCLTTLLIPSSGTAKVNGYDIAVEDNMVKASLGCMLMGERGLYWKLSGRENLDFFGALYHVPQEARKKRIEELIGLLDLKDFIDRSIETYSSGQKMILAFAKSLISDAPILILDEPTVTMDVHVARELRAIVKRLHEQGKTIIYTTHIMQEAEELCERIAIIDRGELIAIGTPEELKKTVKGENIINIDGVIPASALPVLKGQPFVRDAVFKGASEGKARLAVICDDSRTCLMRVIDTLVKAGATVENVKTQEITLEDVFISKTGRALSVDTKEMASGDNGKNGAGGSKGPGQGGKGRGGKNAAGNGKAAKQ